LSILSWRQALIINSLRLMVGKNGLWVATPAVPQHDREGNPLRGTDGGPLYNQIVQSRDRATGERFSALVVELVRQKHAGDLP
jgi:hypothetical protein